MKTTMSTRYALLAAGYVARHQEQGVILSQEIAKQYNIPLKYLLKILGQLVKANILRSKRGPRGGYSLARPAQKITLLNIIEAVEGPMIRRLDLGEHAGKEKFSARAEKICKKALAQAASVLEKTKLSDLLGG